MGVKLTGFDELQKRLNDIQQSMKDLDGTHNVPLSELLPESFMREHTRFVSSDEMIKQSGFKVEGQEDFHKIPDTEWDEYISKNTSFSSWKEMLETATHGWAAKKLGF
jgi:hypothetical protein